MKIDFSRVLVNFDGEELKDPSGKAATFRVIAIEALLSQIGPGGQPENVAGEEKLARYSLAKKVSFGGEVDLKIEEAAKIKELISRCFGAMVVGQVDEIMGKS